MNTAVAATTLWLLCTTTCCIAQKKNPSEDAFRPHRKPVEGGFSFLAGAHYYGHAFVEFHLLSASDPKLSQMMPQESRFGIHHLTGGLSIGFLNEPFAGPSASYLFTSGYKRGIALRASVSVITNIKAAAMVFQPAAGLHITPHFSLLFGPVLAQGNKDVIDYLSSWDLGLVYVFTSKARAYFQ